MSNYLILKTDSTGKECSKKKVVFFTPTIEGGVGRVITNLINGLIDEGLNIELLVVNDKGIKKDEINPKCKIINFHKTKTIQAFLPLGLYLRREKPAVLVSFIFHANIISIFAKIIFNSSVKLIVCEHISLREALQTIGWCKRIVLKFLIKNFYIRSDYVITVSQESASQIEKMIHQKYKKKIITIYNPIINQKIFEMASQPVNHPLFKNKRDYKIILGAGRLTSQKDFTTLIKAFYHVKKQINSKLVILGEGEEKFALENLIREMNLQNDVILFGFVENPYPYYKNADVFVLSSRFEGLPTVLIEAMALSVPVVSTDCPTGPREILDNSKYGPLVPVGDENKLAEEIIKILQNKYKISEKLLYSRALEFDMNKNIKKYKDVICKLF
jgi:glycosyltransferase involved in cell wall biosynthesis